ncbi:MAG TPA: amidohydrolase family protein [Bacteroidales bacterium]|nr:amidohydrolase family protein [Bacteroidales bacterium]
MRRISAQYIFTSAGEPLKRGVVTVADDNSVVSVEDTGGSLTESSSVEFYNGIIIPGLVNCHCHLELSHMHNAVPGGGGLGDFIRAVRETRAASDEEIQAAAQEADSEMFLAGIMACGDISNNSLTFDIKSKSRIAYTTFIEVFGVDTLKAQKRIEDAEVVAAAAAAAGLRHHITPHAVYSVSRSLFTLLLQHISPASLTSLHFLESADEREALSRRRGRIMDSYRSLGIGPENIDTPTDHITTALTLAARTGHLITVHNTCIEAEEVSALNASGNVWFCLCPSSNLHISGAMPPVRLLLAATEHIVTGTDSLASSGQLSILSEMRLLQENFPDVPLDEIIRWGTVNGARALQMHDTLGSIEPGKKPGLLLIDDMDLAEMLLLPQSRVRRLL